MINLEEQFSPRVNPGDANYPFGSIKDNTSPGANDGTPLSAAWGNDWEGFAQAAMTEAGITPSGLPDTAQDSQLLDAVKAVASGALRPSVIEALRRSYAEVGYNLIGTFNRTGLVVNTATDVVLWEPTGVAYAYGGTLPHTIIAAETPVGNPLWVAKDLKLLRNSGVVLGNDGVKYAVSGCAVRRDTTIGPDWAPVSDSAHIPINVTSIVGGVDVRVNYVGKKIGTFVAGPDESFARDGALVGASVAADFANVSIGAPCSFSVDLATGTFEFDNHYFDLMRFGLSIGASGNISITHPGIRTMLHPIIRYVAPSSFSKVLDVHFQNKITNGVTGLYLVGDVEGTISYNGTDWVLGSCDQWTTSDLTFSFDNATGELTVTHPLLVGSPELNISTEYNGAPFLAMSKVVNASTFTVKFFTYSSGSPVPVTAPSSALIVRFSRGRSGIRKAPTGKLLVHLGHVQVNCDHVDYPGGNFWFQATMQN